jgi:HEAT repeat protein
VVAVSPLRNSVPPSATDPLSSVTQELAAVFTTPSAALLDPATGVQALVAAPPAEQVQWIYFETAAALASIPYETAGPSLRALATSGTTPARLWATNCLFSVGSSDEIESLKLNSLQSLEPVLLNPGPDVALTVSMLGNAMLGRITSPVAVPHLSASLGSTNPAIRRSAAGNLSRIATAAVIAPLATLALNDQNPDVRYYAVLGLAKATGVRVRPTRAAFDAAEPDMLAFWSEWAKGNVH